MRQMNSSLQVNLADESEYEDFTQNSQELKSRIALHKPKTVFIDEVQRLPALLNTVQSILDDNTSIKFYLTRSSARKLKRGSANLLPGRVFTYRLGPLSLLDLDFKLDTLRALSLGCLPEPYFSKNEKHAQKLLKSYSGSYLQQEILAETLIRDLRGFSNFLQTASEQSGRLLDLTKLENFTVSKDRIGWLFEHLFFNQLKNIAYSLDSTINVSHYRTLDGQEIDFLLNINRQLIAVELKVQEPAMSEINTLQKRAQTLNPNCKIFVACMKCKPKKVGRVTILDWQTFLKEIVAEIRASQ